MGLLDKILDKVNEGHFDNDEMRYRGFKDLLSRWKEDLDSSDELNLFVTVLKHEIGATDPHTILFLFQKAEQQGLISPEQLKLVTAGIGPRYGAAAESVLEATDPDVGDEVVVITGNDTLKKGARGKVVSMHDGGEGLLLKVDGREVSVPFANVKTVKRSASESLALKGMAAVMGRRSLPVSEHLKQVPYKGLVIRLDRGREMCKWDVANYQTGFVLDRGQSDTYDEALEDAKKFADSVVKNESVNEMELDKATGKLKKKKKDPEEGGTEEGGEDAALEDDEAGEQEVPAPEEGGAEAPEEEPEEEVAPEGEPAKPSLPEKEYIGFHGDQNFYLVRKMSDAGDVQDLVITDQEDNPLLSAKKKGFDLDDPIPFFSEAARELDIEKVEFKFFLKYFWPVYEEMLKKQQEEEQSVEGTGPEGIQSVPVGTPKPGEFGDPQYFGRPVESVVKEAREPKGDEEVCPQCGGDGEGHTDYDKDHSCDKCNGTGVVPKKDAKESVQEASAAPAGPEEIFKEAGIGAGMWFGPDDDKYYFRAPNDETAKAVAAQIGGNLAPSVPVNGKIYYVVDLKNYIPPATAPMPIPEPGAPVGESLMDPDQYLYGLVKAVIAESGLTESALTMTADSLVGLIAHSDKFEQQYKELAKSLLADWKAGKYSHEMAKKLLSKVVMSAVDYAHEFHKKLADGEVVQAKRTVPEEVEKAENLLANRFEQEHKIHEGAVVVASGIKDKAIAQDLASKKPGSLVEPDPENPEEFIVISKEEKK